MSLGNVSPGRRRAVVRRNIAANFVAQTLGVVLNLACVPIFLHLLGAEQYGLVGFAVSLQAMLAVLDLGLATTANREFSRSSAQGAGAYSGPVMLRTLEVIYFGMGAVVAAILVLAAPWIADHWLQARGTPPGLVRTSLVLLGLATGLRWPVGLYSGVLLGLERQVPLNAVIVVRSILRTAGVALLLLLAGGTAATYFSSLVVISCFEVVAVGWLAWRSQPRGAGAGRFEPGVLRSFWSFSGQLTLVSVFAAILKQEDKVVIARYAPLAALGHYTVASTLSGGLLLFATPVFSGVFPRFSALLARGEEREAAALYHRASGLVAMLAAPAAAVLILFPTTVLSQWTRSAAAATEASGALSVLALAMLLNACMQVPYALLLAAGLTRISLWLNGLGVAILGPLLVVLVRAHGIVGGGVAWAIFNLAYFLAAPALLHRYVLKGHLHRWLFGDIFPFFALAAACFGGAAWLGRDLHAGWSAVMPMAGASVLYLIVVAVIWGPRWFNFFSAATALLTPDGKANEAGTGAGLAAERVRAGAYDGTGSL